VNSRRTLDFELSRNARWIQKFRFPREMRWLCEYDHVDWDDERIYLCRFHANWMGFEQFCQNWRSSWEFPLHDSKWA
jgi:hypothetical protein